MKKFILFFVLLVLDCFNINAQPTIQWQKCLGGSDGDYPATIQQTPDSGYFLAGTVYSNNGDIAGSSGIGNGWVLKLNSNGVILWKTLLGNLSSAVTSGKLTSDGGYVVAGYSSDSSSMSADFWIAKLDSSHTIQWQKLLGGSSDDEANSIEETFDKGYIVSGRTASTDFDVTKNNGDFDLWIVKLDSLGNIQWQKSYGGSGREETGIIHQILDGGYIVTVSTTSNDSDVIGNHGNVDFWILKLDSIGGIEWKKCLGGSAQDRPSFIQQSNDGGFIVGGSSGSNDGDVSGNHGYTDCWFAKLDSLGTLQWQKSLGDTSNEYGVSIEQTNNGGYLLSCYVRTSLTASDCWLVKLDSSRNIEWEQTYGGSGREDGSFITTIDGRYIGLASTESNDGDVSGNHGQFDYWVVKLNAYTVGVNEIQNSNFDFQISPNPFSNSTTISFSNANSKNIKIEILDIEGRIIRNLDYKNQIENKFIWDATDNFGNKVEDGFYIVSITSEKFCESEKILFLRN